MKLLAISMLFIIQTAMALPMLNNTENVDIIKKKIIIKDIQLNQLNDTFNFLNFVINDQGINFIISPFGKNRCAGLCSLITNAKLTTVISNNLRPLSFYEYFELYSASQEAVFSAVDFILTRHYTVDLTIKENYLLVKKGVLIGNGVLTETYENKKNREIAINTISNDFKMKFGKDKLSCLPYFNDINNAKLLLKLVSVINFKSLWRNEFKSSSYLPFLLNDGSTIQTEFIENIMDNIVVSNSYGSAYRIFCKNNSYALDIILPHELDKNQTKLSVGYIIDLILKLNLAHQKNKYIKSFIAIPKFNCKKVNNNIINYLKHTLLSGYDINQNINFINRAGIDNSTTLMQDFNIKITKKGINIEDASTTSSNNTLDTSTINKSNSFIINKPFIFLINELSYETSDVVIDKIIAAGKINNPTTVNKEI